MAHILHLVLHTYLHISVQVSSYIRPPTASSQHAPFGPNVLKQPQVDLTTQLTPVTGRHGPFGPAVHHATNILGQPQRPAAVAVGSMPSMHDSLDDLMGSGGTSPSGIHPPHSPGVPFTPPAGNMIPASGSYQPAPGDTYVGGNSSSSSSRPGSNATAAAYGRYGQHTAGSIGSSSQQQHPGRPGSIIKSYQPLPPYAVVSDAGRVLQRQNSSSMRRLGTPAETLDGPTSYTIPTAAIADTWSRQNMIGGSGSSISSGPLQQPHPDSCNPWRAAAPGQLQYSRGSSGGSMGYMAGGGNDGFGAYGQQGGSQGAKAAAMVQRAGTGAANCMQMYN